MAPSVRYQVEMLAASYPATTGDEWVPVMKPRGGKLWFRDPDDAQAAMTRLRAVQPHTTFRVVETMTR